MAKENKELDQIIEKSASGKIDNKKLNEILDKIETENNKFIENNKAMLMGIAPNKKKRIEIETEKEGEGEGEEKKEQEIKKEEKEEEKIIQSNELEIDFEEFTIANKTKNCLIKLFSCLLPFKSDLKKIKIHYNTTVLLVFKIYRFMVLMSFFSLFIFLWECVKHIMKNKKNLSKKCKYSIPCFLQYSSFETSEAEIYSITYGAWLIFFTICSASYYFVLSSEQKEQDSYFENNRNFLGSTYLATSWNFNYKNEDISSKCKGVIQDQLKEYIKTFEDKLDGNNKKMCFLCTFITNAIYVVFIIVYFALFFLPFVVRNIFRNKKKVSTNLKAMDLLGDLIAFLIIVALLHVFNKLTGIFYRFEGWRYESYKYASNVIKKIITSFVGIFALLFIYTYFTLYTNDLKDILSFFGSTPATLFGCPGKYKDHRHTYHSFIATLNSNYIKAKDSSYSKCREEETGIDFLFIFLLYFISTFVIDLFKNCFHCIFRMKPTFDPIRSMIIFFTNIILYSISMFYIPYLALIFPLITLALYKFHYYLLNFKGSYAFKENGLLKRNNTKYLLIMFLIFIIELIGIQGYFYLLSYPHYYKVNCYAPKNGDESILLYDNNKEWCGPIKSYIRLSDIFTELVLDTPFIGWIVSLVQEMPFLISVLALVFIVIMYKSNNPDDKYNEYIRKKQRELDNTFRVYYDQVSQRDTLAHMLINVAK